MLLSVWLVLACLLDPSARAAEAISREVTIYAAPESSANAVAEAISREVTVFAAADSGISRLEAISRELSLEAAPWPAPVRLPEDYESPNLLRESLADTRPTNPDRLAGDAPLSLPYQGIRFSSLTNSGPLYGPGAFPFVPSVQHLTQFPPNLTLLTPAAEARGASLGVPVTQTGRYLITGAFARTLPGNSGNGVSVAVLRNLDTTNLLFGAEISSAVSPSFINLFNGPWAARFTLLADLEAGDVVRFVVFNGASGNNAVADETALEALVVATPLANEALAGKPPVIAEQPADKTYVAGQAARLSVGAFGGEPLAYRWQKQNGAVWIDLTDGGLVAGASTFSLTLSNVSAADTRSYRVRISNPWGDAFSQAATLEVELPPVPYQLSVLAGTDGVPGAINGPADSTRLNFPTSVAITPAGHILFVEASSSALRQVTPEGLVEVFAGRQGQSGTVNGTLAEALFHLPRRLRFDVAGNLLVAEPDQGIVRRISPAGEVSTLAGQPGQRGFQNGPREQALLGYPIGVAGDAAGTVYIADSNAHQIRRIAPDGEVSSLAGRLWAATHRDGVGEAAEFNHPWDIALDLAGNLVVAERGSHVIRRVTPAGEVTTLAGQPGVLGFADGPAPEARFAGPEAVAVDAAGNIFVADTGNHAVRIITPKGSVHTVAWDAGTLAGAGTPYVPRDLAVDGSGRLAIASAYAHTLLRATPQAADAPIIITQPQAGQVQDGDAVTLQVEVRGAGPLTYQWHRDGTAIPGANGAALSFTASSELGGEYQVAVTGSAGSAVSQTTVLEVFTPGELDGQIIFSYREPGASHFDLWTMRADGSGLAPITATPGVGEFDPAISPSQTHVAFVRAGAADPAANGLFVQKLGHDEARQVAAATQFPASGINPPAWLDEQTLIFTATAPGEANGVWSVPATGGTPQLRFTIPAALPGQVYAVIGDLSRDRHRLLLTAEEGGWAPRMDIFSVLVDGTDGRPVWSDFPDDDWRDIGPRWSPDGTTVAFTHWFTKGANLDPEFTGAAVVNADGGGFRWLSSSRQFNQVQSWSPDGKQLLQVRFAQHGFGGGFGGDFWVSRSDGGNPRRVSNLPGEVALWVPGRLGGSPSAHAVWFSPAPFWSGGVVGPSEIALGATATFTATATGAAPLSYQWYRDGIAVPGATEPTLDLAAVGEADAGDYTVEVNNAFGRALSGPATLTVLSPARIVDPPGGVPTTASRLEGVTDFFFEVNATGTPPLSYQWFYGEDPILEGTSPKLSFLPYLTNAHAGAYTVRVTNLYGGQLSTPVDLQVLVPITLSLQPRGTNLPAGGTLVLEVGGRGGEPVAYQWRLNGADIPGATNFFYVVPAVTLADAGTYTVVAENAAGAVTSDPAAVRVLTPERPGHDTFASAAPLDGVAGPVSGDSAAATREDGEPDHAGKPGARSVWYRWTAPAAGLAEFTTLGSAFDTLLAVYTGSAVDALTEVASNDDAGEGGYFTSAVSFTAQAGTTYFVAVDGVGGAGGHHVLGWSFTPAAPVVPRFVTQPQSVTAPPGARVQLAVTVENAAMLEWWFNGVPLAGADTGTLVLPAVNAAQVGGYLAVARGADGRPVFSHEAVVELGAQPGVRSYDKLAELLARLRAEAAPAPQPARAALPAGGLHLVVSAGVAVGQVISPATATTEALEINHCDTLTRQTRWLPLRPAAAGTLAATVTNPPPGLVLALYEDTPDALVPVACANGPALRAVLAAGRSYLLAAGTTAPVNTALGLEILLGTPPPLVTAPPVRQEVPAGERLVLDAGLAGLNPPPRVQWLRDGQPLPGQTAATLALDLADAAQAGRYAVVLDNGLGPVTNAVADVAIDFPLAMPGAEAGFGPDGAFTFVVRGNPGQRVAIDHGDDLGGLRPAVEDWLPAEGLAYRDADAAGTAQGYYAVREVPLTLEATGAFTDGRLGWRVHGGRLGRRYVLEQSPDAGQSWTPLRTNSVQPGPFLLSTLPDQPQTFRLRTLD